MGFINLFTHGLSQYVNIGLSFIIPSITAIYVIANHLHHDMVSVLKKAIVVTCLINCALFLTQVAGLDLIFTVHKQTMQELWEGRPSAFMTYPVNFALLCSVGLILAWEWRKWLCLPIGLCLVLSSEYSVIGGLLAVVSVPFIYGLRRYVPGYFYIVPVVMIGLVLYHFRLDIEGKFALRMKYLYPVIQNIWARPLDGWGVGEYNRLPDSFFGFTRGNWSEMHCEPLDLFFCMGFMGVSVVAGWIYYTVKEWQWNSCSKCLILIAITSFFHSVFHFIDSLWLSIIIYSLWEIEKHEQPDKRPANPARRFEHSSRCCNRDEALASSI